MNQLRWGILSAADIARKNWQAIHDSGSGTVLAVASRDLDRSRRFIEDCQARHAFSPPPAALGHYEALLAMPDIDAVYVPLPTGLRKEWVLRAAAAGKHVLCEKPCGLNAADVGEMIDACRRHRVQFMDGVMFMHHPRLQCMREVLDAGTEVGRIKRIMSVFSFHMTEEAFARNVRVNSLLEPAGCLGDLGWYCIRFALWTMRWQLPREVTGRILSERGSDPSPAPVPTDFSGELVFDGQASAGFYSSFIAQFQQWVNVGGNKGFLHVRDFVHPVGEHEPSFQVNQKEVRVGPAPAADRHAGGSALSQQALMMRNFADQVRSGELNTEWPEMALKTQQVLDACLASARDGSRAVAVEATGRRAETMSRDAPASTP